MKSAIACILCSCLPFSAEARGGELFINCFETFSDGANTAFRVVMSDPDCELRSFGGFSVGYHLLIRAGEEEIQTPLLLPEVDVPSPGMLTFSYVANRVWPEGTRFEAYLYDRDGNMLKELAAKMIPAAYSDVHKIDERVYDINSGLCDFFHGGDCVLSEEV